MTNNTGSAALLLPCLLTGGTEVATLDTATALQALGYRVNAIVYFDETDPPMLAAHGPQACLAQADKFRWHDTAKAYLELFKAAAR